MSGIAGTLVGGIVLGGAGGGSRSPERAYLKVVIGGQDMTSKLRPYLISLQAIDKTNEFDECSIELDDSNGQLPLPPDKASITILMGFHGDAIAQVFSGLVTSVESGFARSGGGGRRLWVDGKGADVTGDGKTQKSYSWGEGDPTGEDKGKKIPLSQVLQDAAKFAGFTMQIDPTLGALTRPFWSMDQENFFHFGQRLAGEFGARFKLDGSTAAFAPLTTAMNALGQSMGSVRAVWGDNLLAWRVKPYTGRPQISKAIGERFDNFKSLWELAEKAVPGASGVFGAVAEHLVRFSSGSKDGAEQSTEGPSADSEANRGAGWVRINGNPLAKAGANVVISGARAGVDGKWQIAEAVHEWARESGYTTTLNLMTPDGGSGVGIDTRVPSFSWGQSI